ncbi:NH(3)-dependent NAD(+) synthetase [Planctomycetes bacterium Pla163]|uniref:NH(3)-dependent NAD(+) synthetase n=1 Tax=Rohdeia mirabilis TaxID=2528008 RepID=A0A518CUW1_9BACT|nr:NH(3)-dependent NAD(+) synthetase [Planctomycetes bacterium Pla163]
MSTAHELDLDLPLATDLLVSFLREEVRSAGMERAVVGLSGGIDSALSLALCARAFGPENTLAVLMPYRTSNPDSEAHAILTADRYGVERRLIDISRMVDGYIEPNAVEDGTRRGNVMARARMTILYDLSVEWRGLVVGTSNKTEMLLGYSTQWGDAAHAINPLGDLYKHQVVQLSAHLGVPREVLEKPPSADLVEGQTDEGDLGFTYDLADRILYRLVDRRYTRADLVAEGFDETVVSSIVQRVVRNQYKRRPPVIAKLGYRTINQDFRYLRDWMS